MRNRDSKSAVKRRLEEKTRKKTEERKVESRGGEPVPAERLSKREGSASRREETGKPNQTKEVIKKHKRVEKEEPRSPSVRTEGIGEFNKARDKTENRRSTRVRQPRSPSEDRVKRTGERANTYSVKKAIRSSKNRARAKRSPGKLSGIHKPNFCRYELILFSSKGAYYESPNCNRKQTKWEYTQMSMCVWNMIKTCMLDRILKLYACNKYPRNYVVTIEYIVCMVYDKINMHTLTIPTIKWKHHISELRFCKMLKHACEFTRNKLIGNSIALVRGSVTHGLCVIREIHVVCNGRVVVELKNQTTSKHFYSKAIIQPSPQIKLWGGYGLRENRKTSYTKLWKIPHLLTFWHIGENMAAASTTNVEMEMGMVDENEIISSSQKRPTMA